MVGLILLDGSLRRIGLMMIQGVYRKDIPFSSTHRTKESDSFLQNAEIPKSVWFASK